MNRTLYTYRGDGYEESPILIQLYNDESFRMVAITKEDLKEGCPWVIAKAMNEAYEPGRRARDWNDANNEAKRCTSE